MRKIHLLCAALLSAATLLSGCGQAPGDPGDALGRLHFQRQQVGHGEHIVKLGLQSQFAGPVRGSCRNSRFRSCSPAATSARCRGPCAGRPGLLPRLNRMMRLISNQQHPQLPQLTRQVSWPCRRDSRRWCGTAPERPARLCGRPPAASSRWKSSCRPTRAGCSCPPTRP